MLTTVDRVQVVVADRDGTADRWRRLLGAEVAREDEVAALGARRTVLAVGADEVELLEPDRPGPARTFMEHTGRGGLFAVGLASPDVGELERRLATRGVSCAREGDQLFLEEGTLPGTAFRAVISPDVTRDRVGVMTRLHEVSFLVDRPEVSARALAELLELDTDFGEARSDQFGFDGVHVYLTKAHEDDIETITPVDADKAMGRFFARRDSSFYMCFGESDDLEQVRALAIEHAPAAWTGPREGPADANSLFIHPAALGGVMLGIRHSTI